MILACSPTIEIGPYPPIRVLLIDDTGATIFGLGYVVQRLKDGRWETSSSVSFGSDSSADRAAFIRDRYDREIRDILRRKADFEARHKLELED